MPSAHGRAWSAAIVVSTACPSDGCWARCMIYFTTSKVTRSGHQMASRIPDDVFVTNVNGELRNTRRCSSPCMLTVYPSDANSGTIVEQQSHYSKADYSQQRRYKAFYFLCSQQARTKRLHAESRVYILKKVVHNSHQTKCEQGRAGRHARPQRQACEYLSQKINSQAFPLSLSFARHGWLNCPSQGWDQIRLSRFI